MMTIIKVETPEKLLELDVFRQIVYTAKRADTNGTGWFPDAFDETVEYQVSQAVWNSEDTPTEISEQCNDAIRRFQASR